MALQTGTSSLSPRVLSMAAMLAAAGFALPPAYAADLGGNCCADLEERVAELEATTARKGNRRVSLTISGAVQTSVMYWDTSDPYARIDNQPRLGNDSDVYIVDQVPGTSVSFSGSAAINPNVSAGFNITLAINSQSRSHHVSQADDDGSKDGAISNNDASFVMTLGNWYLDHKQLGRLTVGRANTATSGLTTIDLGGAGVIANANIGWWNAGFGAAGGLTTWGDLLGGSTVYGASTSRGNIIHYASPTFGGFSVQGAWGENDVWDVALRYAGEHHGFRVAAGIGYIDNHSGTNEHVPDLPGLSDGRSAVKAAASILHVGSGLYFTTAYVDQDNPTGDNTTLLYLQGGLAKNWTGVGNTVVYGEYARVDNAIGGSEADVWGLGIVQHIDAAAMELYLSYRNYSSDFTYEYNAEDMNIVLGGARIRF